MYLFMFLSKSVFSFRVEDSGRKMVELGWENIVDNLKNCWENCEGDWKNYWNDGSGLHGLTVGWLLFCWLHEKFG